MLIRAVPHILISCMMLLPSDSFGNAAKESPQCHVIELGGAINRLTLSRDEKCFAVAVSGAANDPRSGIVITNRRHPT